MAIGSVDNQLESYPEASVSSLKKIAKHIPDKTLKKGGSRHVSKCHKVGSNGKQTCTWYTALAAIGAAAMNSTLTC